MNLCKKLSWQEFVINKINYLIIRILLRNIKYRQRTKMHVNAEYIDQMLEQMSLVKTFYHNEAKKKLRKPLKKINQNNAKLSDFKKLSSSMQNPRTTHQRQSKSPSMYTTFVNIRSARYHLGQISQPYKLKNIEFPQIKNPKKHIERTKLLIHNPQQLSSNFTNSMNTSLDIYSSRITNKQRLNNVSGVRQSWDKYVNIANISDKDYSKIVNDRNFNNHDKKNKEKNQTKYNKNGIQWKSFYKRGTQENIEGWKAYYNGEEQINNINKH